MFNRDEPGYHDLKTFNYERDVPRFNADCYVVKWLESCYSPELKIKVMNPSDEMEVRLRQGGIRESKRTFKSGKEVF
jgi:intein-encoded DNA endonuclease-like protein